MSNERSYPASLAVVRAEFTVVNPELILFSRLSNFQTHFYGFHEGNSEWTTNPLFTPTELSKQIPDRISSLLIRRPYSPTSPVALRDMSLLKDTDVIESAETYSSISLQCVKFGQLRNKKVVISVWETLTDPCFWRFPPYILNVRAVKRKAHLFLAHSRRAISHLERIGVSHDKVVLTYPGVDVEKFFPAQHRDDHNFRILFVGRYDPEKGLETLLEAFSQLYREKPDVELWIRAKRQRGRLRNIALEYARYLPIKFVGSTDYADLPRLYRQCDVLCLPSRDRNAFGVKIWEEQFGFVLLEAMACGLPVIGSRCGAIPEVVGPQNPVFAQSSPKELLVHLRQLYSDENLRTTLSLRNRERVKRLFDLGKQRSLVARTLQELL